MKGLKELNIDYSKIEIEHIERNKPIFKNYPKNLYYNLSHSGNMAMCVISDKNIGCDIQEITEKENILELAKRFFHPDEFKIVQNAQEIERLDYFFRIWTLKESYIKNTGKGLGTSLRDFKICIDDNLKFYINDVLNENYIFKEIQTGDSKYKSAICINKY